MAGVLCAQAARWRPFAGPRGTTRTRMKSLPRPWYFLKAICLAAACVVPACCAGAAETAWQANAMRGRLLQPALLVGERPRAVCMAEGLRFCRELCNTAGAGESAIRGCNTPRELSFAPGQCCVQLNGTGQEEVAVRPARPPKGIVWALHDAQGGR